MPRGETKTAAPAIGVLTAKIPRPRDMRRTIGVEAATVRLLVGRVEQQIHSVLEVAPLMATGFLTALHWDQARALARRNRREARFALRLKRGHPLSASARIGVLAAIVAFGAVPYGEELWRCMRARRTLGPLPEPARPPTETLRVPAGERR
jgi:hypothetical protein